MRKPVEPAEAPSPWLNFFREVRRLAEKLDAMEKNENGEECRETART